MYRSGSTSAPTILPEAKENNYLTVGARGFGYFLFGSAALVSASCMVVLMWLRNEFLIVRSQPFFVGLVCVGSLSMPISILTLSFDEMTMPSELGLDAACMSTMWFFFIGHVLSFSALFTKLRRLNVVLQFKRGVRMTTSRAMFPLTVFVVSTVVILIVWTVVDPWKWNREWVTLIPAETYGQCESEYFWAFFAPLISLVITAEGLTMFFVWKTSDVNEDFGETQPCMYAMYSQFQAWLVGVPILVVVDGNSSNAVFFSRALLIWIFSMSGVVFVIAPKLYKAYCQRRHPDETKQARQNSFHVRGIAITAAGQNSSSLRGSKQLFNREVSDASSLEVELNTNFDGTIKWPDGCSSRDQPTKSITTSLSSCLVVEDAVSQAQSNADSEIVVGA